MNLHEMSQSVTAEKLNKNLEKKFGERIKLEKFTSDQLQDFRNHARTEIFQVEKNESFNSVNTSDEYQKNKMFLDILNAEIAEREAAPIEEKAVSKVQQKAAGAALAAKRGKTKVSHLKGASKKMHKMSTSDLEDFASTKHKNLPARKTKESMDMNFKQKPHGHLESQMQQRQLATIEDAVDELDDLISHAEELPEWVKKKIILATSYVDTVRDYMKSAEAIKRSMDPDTNASTDVDFDIESDRVFQFESLDQDRISNTRAEIIIAAKSLVDKITSWMEDTGEMQTDSMLSLSDSIREEIGENEAKQFIELLKPGIEELYSALENTREIFIDGVNLVAGEEVQDMPGNDLDDTDIDADVDADVDADDSQELADVDDPFAASAAAAGGADSEGREKRESISRSHRLMKILSSKKK